MRNAIQSLHTALACSTRDMSKDKLDAWVYGIVVGWDDDTLAELSKLHGWEESTIQRLIKLHNGFDKLNDNGWRSR
jgi:hypothetical protein